MSSPGTAIHNVSTVYHKRLMQRVVWRPAGPTETRCDARDRARRANKAQNEGKPEEMGGQSGSCIKYTLSSARVQGALGEFSSENSSFDWGSLGDRRPSPLLQPAQQRGVALNHVPAELPSWVVWNVETTRHGCISSLKCFVLHQQPIFKITDFIAKQRIQTLYLCFVLLGLIFPLSFNVVPCFLAVFVVLGLFCMNLYTPFEYDCSIAVVLLLLCLITLNQCLYN